MIVNILTLCHPNLLPLFSQTFYPLFCTLIMNYLLLRVFDFHAPSTTKSVYVCGSWNNYAPSALKASKLERGLWTVTVNIPITMPSQPNAEFVQKYWYYICLSLNAVASFLRFKHSISSTTSNSTTGITIIKPNPPLVRSLTTLFAASSHARTHLGLTPSTESLCLHRELSS
jgi:hypothetical protein